MSEYKLTSGIIANSESNIWDLAKLEWDLKEIYESDEPDNCLCGHYPIIEICILKNKINNNSVVVGNCCVKKFIGLPSDKIFRAVKRIRKDSQKPLNVEAIEYAYEKGWINRWEYDFSIDTARKRMLSVKQLNTRENINNKMLFNMKKKRQ